MQKPKDSSHNVARQLYRRLLRAYPEEFQAEYAGEMEALVRERSRREPVGRLLWELVFDTVRTAPREHLSAVVRDVRHTVRILRRNPGFTAIAILSLAIGIGANSAMFSLADALLLRPLPVREPSEILFLSEASPDNRSSNVSYPSFLDIRNRAKTLQGVVAYTEIPVGFARSKRESPSMRHGVAATGEFFNVLGVNPQVGRGFTRSECAVPGRDPVVVLGNRFWQREYQSDPTVVGSTAYLNGVEFRIIGVAPESFDGLDQFITPDFYTTVMMLPTLSARVDEALLQDRSSRPFRVLARLHPDASKESAEAEIATIGANLSQSFPETNENWRMILRTLLEVRTEQSPAEAALVWILLALAVAVLLIACANVSILLLSRARSRTREVAIRLAIGGGRSRLFRQMMTESFVLSMAGAVAGIGLAMLAIAFFSSFRLPSDLPVSLKVHLDARVLAINMLVACFSAVLFGLLPAFQSLRPDLVPQLKANESTRGPASRRQIGRASLVVAQVALAVVLLAASAMLVSGFQDVLERDAGFRNHDIALATLDTSFLRYEKPQSIAYFRRALREVRENPVVRGAAFATAIPFGSSQSSLRVVPEGYVFAPKQTTIRALHAKVSDGYFDVIGIPIVSGRGILETDNENAPQIAVVNEEFARRYWPGSSAIGKKLEWPSGKKTLEVVGIAKNSRYSWISEPPTPYVYVSLAQHPQSERILLVHTRGTAASALAGIREKLHSIDADMPVFDTRTMESFFEQRAVETPMFILKIVAAMGLCGLVLALTGLYGVVSYSVARRTREIGIRMALGAGRTRVVRMVLREAAVLAGIGIAIGLTGTVFVAQMLEAGFAGLGTADPLAIGLVMIILLGTTLAASVVPARRAARVNPVTALRYE